MSSSSSCPVHLETKRLLLRRLTEDDADHLYELDSDPEVMRYLSNGRTHTRDEIVEKVLPHYLDHSTRFGEEYGFWAAIERGKGTFLGWFHFRPYRSEPEAIELGYRLMRSAWGRGFAAEGSRALIRRGFTELGVEKVVADTLVGNLRSRRVLEAIGMRLEGCFALEADEFPDWSGKNRRGVKYALTRSEWLADRQRRSESQPRIEGGE